MEKTDQIILVTGATGRQGSAAARHLLAAGWPVRTITRDTNKPVAQTLRQMGAEVVQGDNNDPTSLEAAMRNVYGVFSIQFADYDDEVRQGKNVADAASNAGVEHFVYTSVGGAEEQSHLRKLGKWEIEQHIRAIGLPATILRPEWFMEDIVGPRFGVPQGTLATAIKPDVAVQLIAVNDIGAFVALAFDHPDEYMGKTIELAGDALTMPQITAIISQLTGRPIPYIQFPIETIRQQNPSAALAYDFVNAGGMQADIPVLRKLHPGLMNFETWLKREGITF